MRHEHLLLSESESRAVIAEVDSWCRRTGSNYNRLVTAARVAVSTRSAVKHRNRRLTLETASRLRSTMSGNPHGIGKHEHKARLLRVREAFVPPPPLIRVDRSPCPKCGARRDFGCEHWARFERQTSISMVRA